MKKELVWPDDSCSFNLCELLVYLNFIFSHHQDEKVHLQLFYLALCFPLCLHVCFLTPSAWKNPMFLVVNGMP